MKANISYERYQRQIILKAFGEVGQQKLLQAKVLVIGAGGLGCPLLQYLAAAGIGTIGVIDDDVVATSNLHRQILFSVHDIGKLKAERAAFYLHNLNPEISITAYCERLTPANALALLCGYDYIVDGTDNFASRYMINDACVLLNKPLIYGAIHQFEGQVAVFNYKKNADDPGVNYRDLFPLPPQYGEVPNCAEAGVLGILPGIIGMMMANETIKLITGMGEPLINTLLSYNALNNQTYSLLLSHNKESEQFLPRNSLEFEQTNYEWLCDGAGAMMEIDTERFNDLLLQEDIVVVDVREPHELPSVREFPHISIPMGKLEKNYSSLEKDTIIVFCQSGKRSLQAAKNLSAFFGKQKTIYSLKGGIDAWKQQRLNQKQ